jgi:hypothetical protein
MVVRRGGAIPQWEEVRPGSFRSGGGHRQPYNEAKRQPTISQVSRVQWPFPAKSAVGNSAGNSVLVHSRMP